MEELEEIKSSAIEFYANLFRDDQNVIPMTDTGFSMPKISQQQNDLLSAIPTLEEMREVVFPMDSNSTTGLDGFGAKFYQHCWDIFRWTYLLLYTTFLWADIYQEALHVLR